MRITYDVIQDVLLVLLSSCLLSYHLTSVLNVLIWSDVCWRIWWCLLSAPALLAVLIRPYLWVKTDGKAVFITGCDSGLGFLLAKNLHKLGLTVFAGCLDTDGEGATQLSNIDKDHIKVVKINVSSEESINSALEYVQQHLQQTNKVLWGVVNNAGITNFGYVEWLTMDEYVNEANVNLWGVVRVTKAFLPLIRKAKGRIVNISSRLGMMGSASRSPYCIAKHGIEGFSDTLRYELRPFNVNVCLLQPGNYTGGTKIWTQDMIVKQEKKMWNKQMNDEIKQSYKNIFDVTVNNMKHFKKFGISDITAPVDAYTAALLETYPRARYRPNNFQGRLEAFVAIHCPDFVFEYLFVSKVKK